MRLFKPKVSEGTKKTQEQFKEIITKHLENSIMIVKEKITLYEKKLEKYCQDNPSKNDLKDKNIMTFKSYIDGYTRTLNGLNSMNIKREYFEEIENLITDKAIETWLFMNKMFRLEKELE